MCFRSMLCQRKSAAVVLLAAIAAGLATAARQQAHAGNDQASPFAGCYVLVDRHVRMIPIAIDDSGRISGPDSLWLRISGNISDSGSMRLTVSKRIVSLDGGGQGWLRYRYSGFGALDEFGNLYGVLENQYGTLSEFFWPRCE